MIKTFSAGQFANHFSCLSWMSLRYYRGISLSSDLFLFFVLSWHLSGVHLRQTILVLLIQVIDSKLGYSDLKIQYSPSSIYPKSFMSSENTYLSARILLSDILIFQGNLWMASCSFWMRVKMAQTWKVNPHLVGCVQYFSSILMFFPLRFCHSETGSSIHLASGTFCLRISRKVDLPQPMFPSMVQQQSLLGSSGLRVRLSMDQLRFAAKFSIQIIPNILQCIFGGHFYIQIFMTDSHRSTLMIRSMR